MLTQFSRTELLYGSAAMKKLSQMRVAVFGVGGVGGYVCEALVRSGVGAFDLIDNDTVCLTNLNRQIIATSKTIGKYKVDVMKERMLEINPEVNVLTYKCFFLPENTETFPFSEYDYIVDAVDTVTAKLALVEIAKKYNVPIISSMGAGNKLDASGFKVADIYQTNVCPLAKVMRKELKKRGIKSLKVVYSEEKPVVPKQEVVSKFLKIEDRKDIEPTSKKRSLPGSNAFVPSVAGLIIAGEIVNDLTKDAWREEGYKRLEENLMDTLKEGQAKLGYVKESVRLYYPLTSLNHFFESQFDDEKMQNLLEHLPQELTDKLGEIQVTNVNQRFCIIIPEKGSEYVHEHMEESEFIVQLILFVQKHGQTMEDVIALFLDTQKKVEVIQTASGEFDYLIRFEDTDFDPYFYCFKDEGGHITYHRFLPLDYYDMIG